MKLGYQSINGKKNCYNKRTQAKCLRESVLTETDMSKNYILDGGGGGQQNYFDINNINYSKLMNPFYNSKFKSLSQIKISKSTDVDTNCNLIKENNIQPKPHILDHPKETHQHYFPINNNKYGLYIHNHVDDPHTKSTIPFHSFQFFTHRYAKNPKIEND